MLSIPSGWDKKQKQLGASFLQSSLWGDFQSSIGHTAHYIMKDNWTCLMVERKTPLGRYLFAPYGPTVKSADAVEGTFNQLSQYSKSEGFDWLSLEPIITEGSVAELTRTLEKLKARRAVRNTNPGLTRILDLSNSSDELLAAISQSTRSFIRKNQREKFITFKTSTNPAEIDIFTNMLDQVGRRRGVNFYSKDYFYMQAKLLMPAGMMFLEIALSGQKPIAAAVIHDFGQMSSYTYAGSLPEARQTSASALLLWQAMLNAKGRGIRQMDLFGIAPEHAPESHPWHGFSSFKKKFGGQVVERAGTWELPQNFRYQIYRRAQRGRHLLKH